MEKSLNNAGARYFLKRFFRFLHSRYHSLILRNPKSCPPLTLHVEATNRCNLNCVMCFQQTMEREKGFIDFALYKEIIDRAAGWASHLQLANFGEPLLHPDIEKMIRYGHGKGFFVELFTNGLLIDEDCAKMLVDSGVGKINVSIDAMDADLYRQLRKTELVPILENLKRLSVARSKAGGKTPFIVIAGSDLKANPGQPSAIRNSYKSTGADAYYVTPSMNWAGRAKDAAFIKPTGDEYSGCLFPWYLMNVSREGIVTPCCIDAELGNAVGDVKTEDLRAIWNSQRIRKLRQAIIDRDISTLAKISNCHKCSRLFYSQNAYTLNRGRIEIAQLRHFLV